MKKACARKSQRTQKTQKIETRRNHTTPLKLFTGWSRWPRPCISKCHAQQHVLNMHFKSLTISTQTPTHCLFLRPLLISAIHLHHHHNHLYLFRPLTYFQFNTRQSACNPVAKCPYLLSRAFSPLLLTINTHNLSVLSSSIKYCIITQTILVSTTLWWALGFHCYCCWEFFPWHHSLYHLASQIQKEEITPSSSALTGPSTLYTETNMVTFVSSRGSTNAPNNFRILKTTALWSSSPNLTPSFFLTMLMLISS